MSKIDKNCVLTQDAAKAAGDAAKNLLGGIGAMGGSLLGKAAQAATVPPGQQQAGPLTPFVILSFFVPSSNSLVSVPAL